MAKDAEERISRGVLRIAAAHPKGLASFGRCRNEIPNIVNLTAADLAPSQTRPGEPMWHQIVRNIKSHDSEENNYIALGYLVHVPRVGYRITNTGRSHDDANN
jgi:hypothetical protein